MRLSCLCLCGGQNNIRRHARAGVRREGRACNPGIPSSSCTATVRLTVSRLITHTRLRTPTAQVELPRRAGSGGGGAAARKRRRGGEATQEEGEGEGMDVDGEEGGEEGGPLDFASLQQRHKQVRAAGL